MPSDDILTWLYMTEPPCPSSGKMFSRSGRKAPPDWTMVMQGRRCCQANNCARTWRLVVMPNMVPPFTVGSLTINMQARPQTWPTPVMMVAPGGTPS